VKLEINGHSFKLEVVWSDVKAALKAILPLLTAGAVFFAAPVVQKIGALLGLW
jgi:hypothetical protein